MRCVRKNIVLGGGNSGMTVTRQEMLGFGAAFTDAACYMLNQLHSDERAALRVSLIYRGISSSHTQLQQSWLPRRTYPFSWL
jgi:hypothetical protein